MPVSSELEQPLPVAPPGASAIRHVRHFLADFPRLNGRFADAYPRMIVRGEGAFLVDDRGHRVLDAGNHLGACQIGHGRREVAERLAQQAVTLEFSSLDSGASHPYAAALAERLANLVPLDDPVLSFTSSGSESNELAFKIARAFHVRRGQPSRSKILCRDGSYHGSSYAAMSATGGPAFRRDFGPEAPGFVHVAQPSPGRCRLCSPETGCTLGCASAVEDAILREGPDTVAAFIGEPVAILQAVKVPENGYWERVQEICRRYGVLLIADEVVTGFGRTGRMFASEHWGIRPDLMTIAKGMTSGYVPMGATIASREVESAFADRPLLHLNTYAGHPLGCEAAMAVLDVIEREELVARAASAESLISQAFARMAGSLRRVRRFSAIGMLGSIELDVSDNPDADAELLRVRHDAYERGLAIRAGLDGETLAVVFYPPLTATDDELGQGLDILAGVLAEI